MKGLVLLILAAFLMSPLSAVWAAAPLVAYTFHEGMGDVVHDVSGVEPALDLTVADPRNISWIGDGGLSIDKETIVISEGPATKVIEACVASDAITVEAWHKPANDTQGGPARIVTISIDSSNRNISFMQHHGAHHVRLRTTDTGNNGWPDQILQAPTIRIDRMLKGIYSRGANEEAALYMDGNEVAAGKVTGKFTNWDPSYKISLGNEENSINTNRNFLGVFYYVAIYSEALTPDQVLPPDAFLSVEPGEKLATAWGKIKVKQE